MYCMSTVYKSGFTAKIWMINEDRRYSYNLYFMQSQIYVIIFETFIFSSTICNTTEAFF